MKNSKYIILALAVIAVLLIGLIKTPKNSAPVTSAPEVKEICYIYNSEAGDNMSLRIASSDGVSVTGSLNFFSAEKDSKTGNFYGTTKIEDGVGYISAIWDTSGEGVNNKEELFIIFEQNVARVGFGEMKDNGNGVYIYAEPKNISYSLNLQQTDCSDGALR